MGIEARSLKEIVDYTKDFSNRIKRNGIWYRGVVDANFDLVPSLQRALPRKTYHHQMLEIEKKMFDIFRSTQELQDKEFTDWEILYLMQHSGVKTRFLDWSFDFKVSLFFATYNWNKQQNARLWLLDPHLLNEVFYEEYSTVTPKGQKSYFDFLDSYSVSNDIYAFDGYQLNYDDFNKRIKAQSGVFTLHLARNALNSNVYALNNILPIEINNRRSKIANPFNHLRDDFPDAEQVLDYIDIHPDAEVEIKDYLLKKNVTIKTLFPDLPGVVDYINSIFPDFN